MPPCVASLGDFELFLEVFKELLCRIHACKSLTARLFRVSLASVRLASQSHSSTQYVVHMPRGWGSSCVAHREAPGGVLHDVEASTSFCELWHWVTTLLATGFLGFLHSQDSNATQPVQVAVAVKIDKIVPAC